MAHKQGTLTRMTELLGYKNVQSSVVVTIVLYVIMSSSMLVINKVAVTFLPAPSMVLYAQLATSAAAAVGLHHMGLVETDGLDTEKIKKFYLVAFVFLGTIFANIKTLQYANVETFIVFRSSTPLVIAVLDWCFLGRELPNARSFVSLAFITCGAIGYVLTDKGFEVRAYMWVAIWFVVFAIDVVYIKFIVDSVPMTSWGRVYYQNLIALAPLTMIGILTGELQHVLAGSLTDVDQKPFEWSETSVTALLASCVCGVGMSYSAFRLRKEVSATTFTVVGILCKLGTLVVNAMIWDKHASLTGTFFLLICMVAGFFYQQAPLRADARLPVNQPEDSKPAAR